MFRRSRVNRDEFRDAHQRVRGIDARLSICVDNALDAQVSPLLQRPDVADDAQGHQGKDNASP